MSTASAQEENMLPSAMIGATSTKSANGPTSATQNSSQMVVVAIISTDEQFIAGGPWLTSFVILLKNLLLLQFDITHIKFTDISR